ncbi:MAG: pantetheine-phosphate adenylyltransferase [Chloroflexi bacterium]|nr:pantetheine-phosphate adenylyltransferase [Chloroflexota bacterium]
MTIALYPDRFDPVTIGHIDIARRAASLFDHLVVAVEDVPSGTLLSTGERVELFAKAVEDLDGVTVKAFSGLVVEFARNEKASILVRGIRAVTGFEEEFGMALMNKRMAPEIESVYLMTSAELTPPLWRYAGLDLPMGGLSGIDAAKD